LGVRRVSWAGRWDGRWEWDWCCLVLVLVARFFGVVLGGVQMNRLAVREAWCVGDVVGGLFSAGAVNWSFRPMGGRWLCGRVWW
jgi:hypothetical protein